MSDQELHWCSRSGLFRRNTVLLYLCNTFYFSVVYKRYSINSHHGWVIADIFIFPVKGHSVLQFAIAMPAHQVGSWWCSPGSWWWSWCCLPSSWWWSWCCLPGSWWWSWCCCRPCPCRSGSRPPAAADSASWGCWSCRPRWSDVWPGHAARPPPTHPPHPRHTQCLVEGRGR